MFLAYWQPIVATILTFILSYGLHRLDVYRLEDNQRQALEEQSVSLQNNCKKVQAITEGVSNDYHKKIINLNASLVALKRVQPSRCVPLSTANATRGNNDSNTPSINAGQDGVTSEALIDFAGDAERYRLQLNACQAFITAERQ